MMKLCDLTALKRDKKVVMDIKPRFLMACIGIGLLTSFEIGHAAEGGGGQNGLDAFYKALAGKTYEYNGTYEHTTYDNPICHWSTTWNETMTWSSDGRTAASHIKFSSSAADSDSDDCSPEFADFHAIYDVRGEIVNGNWEASVVRTDVDDASQHPTDIELIGEGQYLRLGPFRLYREK